MAHHDDAGDDLSLAVRLGEPATHERAERHVGDVAHEALGGVPCAPAAPWPCAGIAETALRRLLSESMRNCEDVTMRSPARMPSSTST